MQQAPAVLLPGFALTICLLLGMTQGVAAADRVDDNGHLWLNYLGDHPLRAGSPWILHLEVQARRSDFGADWQQLLLRPAIYYRITPQFEVGAGYAYVETHPYGDFPARATFPEHRLFEQLLYRQSLAGVGLSHRLRLEQRDIGEPGFGTQADEVVNYRYENRVRYALRAELALGAGMDDKPAWYLALSDEVFFNFGGNVANNHFDQNRAYFGVGRRVGQSNKIEVGFLEQTLKRRDGVTFEHNHTVLLQFMSGVPLPF